MIISVFLETFGRFSRLCHGAVLSARKRVKRKYSFTLVNALGIIHVYSSGGGEVSPRKSVVQSAGQYDVTSRVTNFQNGEQSVHRRDRKRRIQIDFIAEILFRFLGFEDFKASFAIEN